MLSKVERPKDPAIIKPLAIEDYALPGPVTGLRALLSKPEAPKEEPLEVPKVSRDDAMYNKEFARLRAWEMSLLRREDEIETLKADVFRLAEEEGLKAGYREGWEESKKERKILQNISAEMQKEFAELKRSLAPAVLELAIHAARHIVHESCSLSVEQAARNVTGVVSSLGLGSSAITIRANKKTIDAIGAHDQDGNIFASASFEVDNDLEDGGFYIAHSLGAVDSTIETRWDRAMSQLGAMHKYKSSSVDHSALEEKINRLPSSILDSDTKDV